MNCKDCHWWTDHGCNNTNWITGRLTNPETPVCGGISFTKKEVVLERLIGFYEQAIAAKNQPEIDRLCAAVEKEADRIGYTNHGRLYQLHTAAEKAGLEDGDAQR